MLGPQRKVRPALDLPDIESTPTISRPIDRSRESGIDPPGNSGSAADEKDSAKQALAANLEGMIEGMLRDTQFATSASTKTRGWVQQIGEAAALDASTDDSAFTANSLIADLMQARGSVDTAAVRPAAPRRRWIDAVLVLACLLSVASAGYFTFAQ